MYQSFLFQKILSYYAISKDRLMSFDGKEITYDSKNPLNPRTYNGYTYEFEGRLTRYIYDRDKLITEISLYHRLDLYMMKNDCYIILLSI